MDHDEKGLQLRKVMVVSLNFLSCSKPCQMALLLRPRCPPEFSHSFPCPVWHARHQYRVVRSFLVWWPVEIRPKQRFISDWYVCSLPPEVSLGSARCPWRASVLACVSSGISTSPSTVEIPTGTFSLGCDFKT